LKTKYTKNVDPSQHELLIVDYPFTAKFAMKCKVESNFWREILSW